MISQSITCGLFFLQRENRICIAHCHQLSIFRLQKKKLHFQWNWNPPHTPPLGAAEPTKRNWFLRESNRKTLIHCHLSLLSSLHCFLSFQFLRHPPHFQNGHSDSRPSILKFHVCSLPSQESVTFFEYHAIHPPVFPEDH